MTKYNEEQQKVLDTNGNVLVSASAGSGKTTVMIEKIYNLIVAGYDVSRMVVMTFSRASAQEMRNRLVKKLYEAIGRGGAEGEKAQKQLEYFPFSNICTIDSFCYALLRKYYAVTGDDPSATPLDPDEESILWNECVDRACELGIEENGPFIRFAEKYSSGRRLDKIKELIGELKKFLQVQVNKDIFFEKDFTEDRKRFLHLDFCRRLKEILVPFHDLEVSFRAEGMEQYLPMIWNFREQVTAAYGTADFDGLVEKLVSFAPITVSSNRKDVVTSLNQAYGNMCKAVGDIRDKCVEFRDLMVRSNEGEMADIKVLLAVTDRALTLYGNAKKKRGKIDFSDMGRIALNILKDEKTAEEVKDSYDFIFVDEYQDTNYIQEELLRGISREDNVFVVGDVKQAIYKFRYAEPEIFNERSKKYLREGVGKNIHLNVNYRSRAEILRFVNEVFGEIMTEGYCGVEYKDNPMEAGTRYEDKTSAVEIYTYTEGGDNVCDGVYSVRNAEVEKLSDIEGEFVAKRINELVNKEYIYRPKEETSRTVRYGDIAVLTRTGREGRLIADALSKKGIPYSISDEDGVKSAAKNLLVDFLRICTCEDDVPLIHVLDCPLFGFLPDDFTKLRKKDTKTSLWGALTSYNEDGELKKKIEYFLSYIEDLRKKTAYLPASSLMTKLLNDGLAGYFDGLRDGTAEKLSRFVENIKTTAANRNVEDFLYYYDTSYKGEKPPARPDSVIIMTMHKSKGLEFPVVFLPYCSEGGAREGNVDRTSFLADRDLGLGLKEVIEDNAESCPTFATKVIARKKKSDGRQELMRLTYVDFTRAENKLIIICENTWINSKGEETAPKSLFDVNTISGFVRYAAQKNPRIMQLYREIDLEEISSPTYNKVECNAFSLAGLEEGYRHEESTRLPNKQTVTALYTGDEEGYYPMMTGREKGDPTLGTAYHLYMQKADLGRDDEKYVVDFIAELVKNNEIEEETAKKLDVKKIKDLLNTEIIKSAKDAVIYREQPFIAKLEQGEDYTLVQGVVDLIIEGEEGLTIVDFKASGLSREKLYEKYSRQLQLYSEAIGKIYGKKIVRRVLLNILKNYSIDV